MEVASLPEEHEAQSRVKKFPDPRVQGTELLQAGSFQSQVGSVRHFIHYLFN